MNLFSLLFFLFSNQGKKKRRRGVVGHARVRAEEGGKRVFGKWRKLKKKLDGTQMGDFLLEIFYFIVLLGIVK